MKEKKKEVRETGQRLVFRAAAISAVAAIFIIIVEVFEILQGAALGAARIVVVCVAGFSFYVALIIIMRQARRKSPFGVFEELERDD